MSAVDDGFVWLEFPNGTRWHCPPGAVEMWLARGGVPCDEPAPVDPAIAERPTPPTLDTPAQPAAKTRKSEKE